MARVKGRASRSRGPGTVLYARVEDDVMRLLDHGAAALGISRAAYVELLLRRMQVDEYGLPAWARELVDAEQLPLPPLLSDWQSQEGAGRAAA